MRLDPASVVGVASLLLAVACKPTFQPPEAPGEEPTPTPQVRHLPGAPGGRGAVLGEMCPTGADGRPGLSAVALRGVSWTTDRAELDAVLARGQAAEFAVLAIDGKRAGRFSVVGAADGAVDVAVGSYAGAPPCTRGGPIEGKLDEACVAARSGCGLAVAAIGAPGGMLDERDPPPVVVGGACRAGDDLAIDVDGDGAAERFPLAAFLDDGRAPEEEVTAVASAAATCTPVFALSGLTVPDASPDPRLRVDLDVLGVVDVDGDGRRELVLGLRYPDRRTIAVWTAVQSAARLELVGEVAPWIP